MPTRKRVRDEFQTPLGREYFRLASWTTEDPVADTFAARRTVRAKELAVWTAAVRNTKFAVGPPTDRPNPVVTADLVLCSTFSPGRVVAFDRDTGARRWTVALSYYGDPLTLGPPASGLVYAGTSQELVAIELASGRVAWSFCPYGRDGETLYSLPTVAGGRLFVGDRNGYLHCLHAATGKPVWRVLPSRAANNDVNSNPVVFGGVVAVGTNAGLAVGYEAVTGREAWRRRLAGPCTGAVPAGNGTALFWSFEAVYHLSVSDGRPLARWRRRNHVVEQACVAGELTLVVTRREWGLQRELWPTADLRAYRGDEELYVRTYPRWAQPAMRYERATRRVYEATAYGLGILNPRTGERETVIRFAKHEGSGSLPTVGLPTVLDGCIYAVRQDGRLFALQHP